MEKLSFHLLKDKKLTGHRCVVWETVVASFKISPLCKENLNTFLTRLQKLFMGGNYSRKYGRFGQVCIIIIIASYNKRLPTQEWTSKTFILEKIGLFQEFLFFGQSFL